MRERYGETQAPETCEGCGKQTGRYWIDNPVPWFEEYQGNEQVMAVEKRPYVTFDEFLERGEDTDFWEREEWDRNMSHRTYTVRTWDGESYHPNQYGSFCTLRCAWRFAEDAVKSGMRRL